MPVAKCARSFDLGVMAAPASSTPCGFARPLIRTLHALCLAWLVYLTGTSAVFAAKWGPVDPLELADTKPQVDPEAGAEILFREVSISHTEVNEFVRDYHVRAKIYTERGLGDFTKIEIPYSDGQRIRDINVRTIKPDGEIIELTRKDVYDREVIKVGRERTKVKSFSPAGLEPGAIVEYTYTEISYGWSWYVTMIFETSLPARFVRFRFQPIDFSLLTARDSRRLSAHALFFNFPKQPLKPDSSGFIGFEMRNVAAAKEEPFQPPLISCRTGVLLCYSLEKNLPPKAFWAKHGKDLHDRMLRETKATKLVQTTLAALISDSDSEEQKLRKIHDYCRAKIINRYSDTATFTREQRAKFKTNKNASDTLEAGHGSGEDINIVFVALARAAGFDARLAACNNRDFIQFSDNVTEPFMADDLIATVQFGGQWLYFDPGVPYLPFGMPYWRNAATVAITAAAKDAAPAQVHFSPAERSVQKRSATFRLDVDGTLEGDVTVEYSGHQEVFEKLNLDEKTPAERETIIREDVQAHLKLAEVTNIKVENASDPLAQLKISFHLRVPEYADRTGSRLFFQPAVFQKNVPPLLTEETRRTDLVFRYCYTDTDDIRITPPEGFEFEQASSPGSLSFDVLGSYDVSISLSKRTQTVNYSRIFTLRSPQFAFPYYPAIREAFDLVNKYDAHTLTLKRKASPVAEPAPASAAQAASPASTPSATASL